MVSLGLLLPPIAHSLIRSLGHASAHALLAPDLFKRISYIPFILIAQGTREELVGF